MSTPREAPGRAAIRHKGWLRAHKWLLLRRASQFGLLAVFLLGPLCGVWLVKGSLSSSLTLDVLPLSDPLLVLQSLAAAHLPWRQALIGAAIVSVCYLVLGGRVFCAWVCPVNVLSDAAAALRRRLGLRNSGRVPPRATRQWLLGGVLLVAALGGGIAWEAVNPVTLLHRALVFGGGIAWLALLALFLYDLLVAPRGWCGHLCPVGACYSLLGHCAIPRVAASQRAACNDCMDCFAVCPEAQVIRPALKGEGQRHALILDADCSLCGRCIDVCAQEVFRTTTRFNRSEP